MLPVVGRTRRVHARFAEPRSCRGSIDESPVPVSQCDRTVRFLVVTLPVVAISCAMSCALASCKPETVYTDPEGPRAEECAPLSSGALTIEGIEGLDDYDGALAAALEDTSLPASISLAPLSDFERSLVLYMLDAFELDAIDRDSARERPLGRAVLGAFASGAVDGVVEGVDVGMLRRGLHRFYACDRGFPATLAEFNETIADVAAMDIGETVDSRVKNLPRRMRRSVVDGVFVAETLVGPGPDQTVRETEIVLTDRRNDGALEFLEYDEAGDLRGASEFASSSGAPSVGSVPFACIACHGTRDVTPQSP